jgi:hypothetical protein
MYNSGVIAGSKEIISISIETGQWKKEKKA